MASMLHGDKMALLENNRDNDGGTNQKQNSISITDDASDKIGTVSNEDKLTSNEAVTVEDDVVHDMDMAIPAVLVDDGDMSAAWTDTDFIETKFY
jgi:hypothetical protein